MARQTFSQSLIKALEDAEQAKAALPSPSKDELAAKAWAKLQYDFPVGALACPSSDH
jgi:hypothetical protein